MKIGIVLANTPTYSETFFIAKIKGLQNAGHQVALLVNHKSVAFGLCKVKATPVQGVFNIIASVVKWMLFSICYFSRILKFTRLERKDNTAYASIAKKIFLNQHILFARLDWLHFGFATMAIGRENLAKAIGAKMAVSIRGFDMGIYPLKHPNCYQKVWKNIDKLHYISDDLLQLSINNGFNTQKKHQKITPAIDVNLFLNNTTQKKETEKLAFLTVGRLHWKKGYEDAILALKILKDKGVDFTYSIVGTGSEEEKLKYLVYELGLTKEVVFLGKLPQKEIVFLMRQSDIYIQYSVQEGFCNAVLEAQATGMLCVVSNAEGLPENVLNNITGWVVPKNKPTFLTQKILEILALSAKDKKAIQSRAVARVQKEFNIKQQQKAFVVFYQS